MPQDKTVDILNVKIENLISDINEIKQDINTLRTSLDKIGNSATTYDYAIRDVSNKLATLEKHVRDLNMVIMGDQSNPGFYMKVRELESKYDSTRTLVKMLISINLALVGADVTILVALLLHFI